MGDGLIPKILTFCMTSSSGCINLFCCSLYTVQQNDLFNNHKIPILFPRHFRDTN